MARDTDDSSDRSERSADHAFLIGLARAFGGAIFFSMPLLMTMEMWSLGFTMGRLQLALLTAVFIPVLVGLAHFSGFKATSTLSEAIVDALVAYAVGSLTAALVLWVFGVIQLGMPAGEILGKIVLQSVPASVGAALAVGLLGGDKAEEERRKRDAGYAGSLFLMAAGAIFFAFNVAPTEEMVLIAQQMSAWQVAALGIGSLIMMHAFVYGVEFHGGIAVPRGVPWWSIFLRYTVAGYAVALAVSAYVLWTFGRFDGVAYHQMTTTTLVLGFPASLGAAAARLVL
ncbi:MAG TPA: TIGR02587 family membrane protein [Gemmatimonadaceae bacterium]